MHGSSYIWGFLVPASILLFVGFYLSAQLSGAVKLTAALQIDQRARNKIIKRRGLQIGLFFKVDILKFLSLSFITVTRHIEESLSIIMRFEGFERC